MIPVPEFRVNSVTKLKSRIAEGKYLKMLYDLHDKRGTLNVDKKELGRTMYWALFLNRGTSVFFLCRLMKIKDLNLDKIYFRISETN